MTKTVIFALSFLAMTACGGGGGSDEDGPGLGGSIRIDGSSTVYPITEAAAEEFNAKQRSVRITIGVSGTGGGFKKFCAGEVEITGASRTIKDSEKALCAEGGVEFIELPVAYDGISVVVHPSNDFVDHLTVAELKTIWSPEAEDKLTHWNQVRASFPNTKLALFGPGPDSGTFDYFTRKINGAAQASRGDYTASEDDNTLVHGVANNEGALGYFGFAYYAENPSKLKAVPIKAGEGPAVSPSLQSIGDGSYKPLSRPVFIYVRKDAADRPEVEAFVEFYLGEGLPLAEEVGYITLPDAEAAAARSRFSSRTVGSAQE
jgi:phosphate transport system substrate-binding protein